MSIIKKAKRAESEGYYGGPESGVIRWHLLSLENPCEIRKVLRRSVQTISFKTVGVFSTTSIPLLGDVQKPGDSRRDKHKAKLSQ